MLAFLKELSMFRIIFLFFCAGLFPWNSFGKNLLELVTISPGNDSASGGHSALRIGDKTYTFNVDEKSRLKLWIQEFDQFRLYYNVTEERDFVVTTLEVPESTVSEILSELQVISQFNEMGMGLAPYHVLKNNCATALRKIFNKYFPENQIPETYLTSIPRAFLSSVRERYEISQEEVFLSRRHTLLKDSGKIWEYIVPLSNISPKPDHWRLVYTEDLKGVSFVLRPVAGVSNFGAATAQTLFGIVSLPWSKKNISYGLGGLLKTTPEFLFYSVSRAEGRGIPEKGIVGPDELKSIFLDYQIPETLFIGEVHNDHELKALFIRPDQIKHAKDLEQKFHQRWISEQWEDYTRDSVLRTIDLKDRQWVIEKRRRLNIDHVKKFKKQNKLSFSGHGVTVLVLESQAKQPRRSDIAYVNFSSEEHFIDSHGSKIAEFIKESAPDSKVILATYRYPKEITKLADWAKQNRVDLVVQAEVFTTFGSLHPKYQEKSFYNQLAQKMFDHGILWVNSAGNFRKKFSKFSFTEKSLHQTVNFHAEKGKKIRFDLNWIENPEDDQRNDRYSFKIFGPGNELLRETQDSNIIWTAQKSGDYYLRIDIKEFSPNRKSHVLRLFSNQEIQPSTPNESSLASPANSRFVITIGASSGSKPDPISSEDNLAVRWEKPDFYAPSKTNGLTGSSSAVAYGAAWFAILLGH